jgi:hypothetical protein
MKFLTKKPDSEILAKGLRYTTGRTGDNQALRNALLDEQKGFCAYTEEVLEENTLSEEVEHFNPGLKSNDNYYNYYTVSRYANLRKMKVDRQGDYKGAPFYTSLFFQNELALRERVAYHDGWYRANKEDDNEAKQFIDYLGFNDNPLFKKRNDAVARIRRIFEKGAYTHEDKLEYFRENPLELSFITALEKELQIDLTQILNEKIYP